MAVSSFTEAIYSAWLPAAIRYGIPYDTFWRLNPRIMQMYQDAHIRNMEEQRDLINYSSWLQGQYNMAAIGAAMSKKVHYPKKPFMPSQKEDDVSGEERFVMWIQEFNRRFE